MSFSRQWPQDNCLGTGLVWGGGRWWRPARSSGPLRGYSPGSPGSGHHTEEVLRTCPRGGVCLASRVQKAEAGEEGAWREPSDLPHRGAELQSLACWYVPHSLCALLELQPATQRQPDCRRCGAVPRAHDRGSGRGSRLPLCSLWVCGRVRL